MVGIIACPTDEWRRMSRDADIWNSASAGRSRALHFFRRPAGNLGDLGGCRRAPESLASHGPIVGDAERSAANPRSCNHHADDGPFRKGRTADRSDSRRGSVDPELPRAGRSRSCRRTHPPRSRNSGRSGGIRRPATVPVRIIWEGASDLTARRDLVRISCSHSQGLLGLFPCFTPKLISLSRIGFGVPPKSLPGMPFSPRWNGGLIRTRLD